MRKQVTCVVLGLFLVGCFSLALAAEEKDKGKSTSLFSRVDFNQDGKVSLEEHLAWEKGLFTSNDRNGDGYISSQEVAEFKLEQINHKRKEAGQKLEFELREFVFSPELDTDGDSRVSLAEHLAWETKNFQANDLNNDRYITWDEILEKQRIIRQEVKRKVALMRQRQRAASQKSPQQRNYQD